MSIGVGGGDPAVGTPEWSEGEHSEPERNGGVPTAPRALMVPSNQPEKVPDPEVGRKAKRRRFAAKYKLEVLRKADECGPGQIGALLRKEGLYYSILTEWRRQREKGELEGLTPRKRGRKSTGKHDPVMEENRRLRRELERTQKRPKKAEIIIEVQKTISDILARVYRVTDWNLCKPLNNVQVTDRPAYDLRGEEPLEVECIEDLFLERRETG